MVIHADDRVATVLAHDASLVDVFVSVSPAFERLRNPAMRRVMSRLVTVRQAARMGGVDPDELLARLNAHVTHDTGEAGDVGAAGDVATDGDEATEATRASARPAALAAIAEDRIVTADVRDELRAGREPFSLIMAARREVPDGGALCVRAIFEPVPLYTVMKRQGLTHWTERLADDDWVVWFYEDAAPETAPDTAPAATQDAAQHIGASADAPRDAESDVIVLDVRGLEPPEPMMRTLEALEAMPAGATLVQINARVPQFLLPMLDERGYAYELREQDDGIVRLFIRRVADAAHREVRP